MKSPFLGELGTLKTPRRRLYVRALFQNNNLTEIKYENIANRSPET